jgi:hypothetical protein
MVGKIGRCPGAPTASPSQVANPRCLSDNLVLKCIHRRSIGRCSAQRPTRTQPVRLEGQGREDLMAKCQP